MESTESRFSHLLQPIRELTKNRDVDVASELDDYLEELDDMCITLDGGKTRLNFAEAALLIQGSACISSKKVELLHNLVYQTLEYINDRNRRRNKQTAASEKGDADGAASSYDADDEAAVAVAPLPPESLVPLESTEKNKLPLISVKGEILCSQKDFRINIFIPGDEALILLTLGSAASRFRSDQGPADSVQRQRGGAAVGLADAEGDGGDAAQGFLPLDDNNVELDQDQDQDPEEHVNRHQALSDGRTLRERRRVGDGDLRRTKETAPAVSAWTLHDPYAVLGEDKPFKSGKCYKVPDGLDDGGKRKRKRPASLQDFRSWFRGTFDPPEHKLKNGPTFTDLNYIYLSTMKDKLQTRKRICRKEGVVVSDEELRRTFLQPEEAGPHQQGEEPVDGFRHPDLLGGDDDDSDNEHEAFPDDVPAEFVGGADFISADGPREELSYEDLVKLRVEQLVVNSRGYTQESALSRRVKDWEDQIHPQLELQEERAVFDIHDYSGRIVGALNAVGVRRSFSSIVAGSDNFEACRYLLASLQLANDYSVEVDSVGGLVDSVGGLEDSVGGLEDSVGGLEDSVDSMGLTLLSTQRATDRFKTLTASASNT